MKKKIQTIVYLLFVGTSVLFSQEKKAGKIVTEYFSYLDSGNSEAVSRLLTEDFKAWAPFAPGTLDKKTWMGAVAGFHSAFPDLRHEVLNWFADDQLIAARTVFTGTNTGSLMGNPATGNKVKITITSIFELDGKGKIKSLDVKFDNKSFESQLMAGLPGAKMTAEKTVRDLFAVMDVGETDKFANYCSPDFTISNPFLSAPSPIGAFKGIIQSQKTAFPDLKHQVLEMTSDGKFVTTRGMFTGTNTGSMMGNPPTGNKVNLPFLVLDELDAKGKIKMRNVQFDVKSFESQLMAGINPNAVIETNIRAMFAAADQGDIDHFLSYWSDHSHPYFLGVENTRDEVKQRILDFKKGFPDVKRSVDELIISGNKVIVRGVLTGTNKGSFMGKPATNKPIRVTWLGLYHFKQDGKIENGWVEFDSATMQNQLNKKPMTKKGSK